MPAFEEFFASLRGVLTPYLDRLTATADTPAEFTLYGRKPSPFPQHKGQPVFFASVKVGKAYVSYHLLPLYMNEKLTATVPPVLKKRLQGKACFNFKTAPDSATLAELFTLTSAGFRVFDEKGWL